MDSVKRQRQLKHLKWQLVASGLVFWGGVVWMFFGLVAVGENDTDGSRELIPQAVTCVLGLLWYLVIRVRFWMLNE